MKISPVLIVAGLVIVGFASYRLGLNQATPTATALNNPTSPAPERKPLYWHDPMVPNQRFYKPGKSPFMDMELVPVYAAQSSSTDNSVTIDSRIAQNLGVRTALVVEGKLASTLTAVGNVAYNEREVALVQARSNGFVEQVYVRTPLERVKKGQPLAQVTVPDWIAAQEEYLTVVKMQGQHLDGMVEAAHQRMLLVGMSEEQINQVSTSGKGAARLSITAPISGVVTELTLRPGMTINTGASLFRINGLTSVWVNAEVPENLAAQVRAGDRVEARVAALPGLIFKGRVSALLPEVNAVTRTLKARIELVNLHGELVPGMFATIHFLSGRSSKNVMLVPSEAVIQTGTRSVIMVEQEPGKFEPVTIETGNQAQGQTEVITGLTVGQKVVVSGQFLIDSEASLKGSDLRMTRSAPPAQHQEGS